MTKLRDVKFRFWDNCIKHMYYGSEIDKSKNESRTNWYSITEDGLIAGNVGPSGMDNYDLEVMQYTGIKDKNGREIYEGDIYHMGDKNIRYVIVWKDTGLIGKQLGSRSYAGLLYWKDKIEIIGNIYDNSELLEERKK